MINSRIKIFGVTLRDGEKSPGCSTDCDEKRNMALHLEALGVVIVEAGFSIASANAYDAAVAALAHRALIRAGYFL